MNEERENNMPGLLGLQEFDEGGRTVLRVVIPDGKNRFPEDTNCEYPYTLQIFDTEFLSRKGGFSQ